MASQASQDLDDFTPAMNGIATASQEIDDFDEEEDDFESAQTLAIQETVDAGVDDAFTMQLKLEDMTNTYTEHSIAARNAVCHMLAAAGALEDLRMVCQKLPPKEFSKLVSCAVSITKFHASLEIINPQIASCWTFSKQVKTMRALIAKFPDILGVIPMNNIDLMATTLLERFNISTMTSAMTLTLTEEEQVEAIEKANLRKAANKAKKEEERKILAIAGAAQMSAVGERGLRKRARDEVAKYVDDEAQDADDDERGEPETAAEGKKARKGPSQTDKLKAQVIELQKKLAASEARVAELEQQLTLAN